MKMKRLVVVAGPTSAGKSTFIRKMLSNNMPKLAERLGVENFTGWETTDTGATSRRIYDKEIIDGLIFHYDFLRPFGRSAKTHDRDVALHILGQADEVSFITLYVDSNGLKSQIIDGEFYGKGKGFKKRIWAIGKEAFKLSLKDLIRNLFDLKSVFGLVLTGASSRHRQILKKYEDPKEVIRLYRWWLDYLDRDDIKSEHNIIIDPRCDRFFSSRSELEESWR